jgi:CheY-like chemotaxis protein
MVRKFDNPLLIVEDSDEDFVTLKRLMKKFAIPNPVYRCVDGDEVLEFIYREGDYQDPRLAPRPSVILMDLNLPGTDGREVLDQLKRDEEFKEIPIVVFTTSSNPKDIEFCYQHGANGYLVKPISRTKLQDTVQAFVDYWLEANTNPAVSS